MRERKGSLNQTPRRRGLPPAATTNKETEMQKKLTKLNAGSATRNSAAANSKPILPLEGNMKTQNKTDTTKPVVTTKNGSADETKSVKHNPGSTTEVKPAAEAGVKPTNATGAAPVVKPATAGNGKPLSVEEGLQIRRVPIDSIKLDNKLSELVNRKLEVVEAITESMRAMGFDQTQPIVIDNDMTIADGYTRMEAAKKAGLSHVYVVERKFADRLAMELFVLERALVKRNLTDGDYLNLIPKYDALYKKPVGNPSKVIDKKAGDSAVEIGKRLGICKSRVQQVRYVHAKAKPSQKQQVFDGKITINKLHDMLKAGEDKTGKLKKPAKAPVSNAGTATAQQGVGGNATEPVNSVPEKGNTGVQAVDTTTKPDPAAPKPALAGTGHVLTVVTKAQAEQAMGIIHSLGEAHGKVILDCEDITEDIELGVKPGSRVIDGVLVGSTPHSSPTTKLIAHCRKLGYALYVKDNGGVKNAEAAKA